MIKSFPVENMVVIITRHKPRFFKIGNYRNNIRWNTRQLTELKRCYLIDW